MQTRKDLLQAHRLMTQRAGLALVQGQPDTAEQPLRRMNIATFAGVMVAVLIAAVFGIIGAISHTGGQLSPGASGVVVMDSDTGTSYIWCSTGGRQLCPAVNYASARLAAGAGGNGVTVQGVSQGALTHYPQGQEIGIPGLPALPLPGNLIRGPWSVCVAISSNATRQQQVVTLVAGRSVGGQPVNASKAVLVQAQGRSWLIWNGQRLAIQQAATTILQGSSQQAAQVPAQWLNSLPKGPPFQAPPIPGAGAPTANGPPGATVGQVYKVAEGSGFQWFVQLAGGVAKISETDGLLLQATAQSQVTTPTISQISGHVTQAKVGNSDLPQVPPTVILFGPTAPLCAVYNAGSGPAAGEVALNGVIPSGALPAAGATPGNASVNRVWLPPNKGALIGVSTVSGQQSATTYFLVVGATKYALAARAATTAADLGYSLGAQSVLVPVNISDLIPRGSTLDPTAARLPVAQQAVGG
ncbi:MAG: type VII secretion protein EccB [Micromonosporaceae bacterium]